MKKNFTLDESKLARFSAVAGAVIAGGSVNAQLIYTDVNPDIIIDTASGPYDLDFNGVDTDITLTVAHVSGAGSQSGFSFTYDGTVAGVSAAPGAGVIGMVTGSSSTFAPTAMDAGQLIDGAANFGASGGLAIDAMVTVPMLSYTFPIQQGEWLGVSDKFLGVKFTIGANTHYGWARLDVSAGADTIRLKDYAYNQNFDLPLLAGQSVGLDDISVENKVSIKTTLNEAYINVTPDLIGGRIAFINMAGQEVKSVEITDIDTKVPFEGVETGIYMVAAQFDAGSVTKKVYVK